MFFIWSYNDLGDEMKRTYVMVVIVASFCLSLRLQQNTFSVPVNNTLTLEGVVVINSGHRDTLFIQIGIFYEFILHNHYSIYKSKWI